ncbi:crossover junction endodeoxyribonuclease RuvC [Candidatus Beckwithbacteria bacterium]|nr:crossover junction endodeoxyribonuclease RuvC [Candidatus Beckwithbacteria bacterium]
MNILGIDPGYGRVGWGVISKDGSKTKYIDCSCFETKVGLPFARRLELIYVEITTIIKKFEIEEVAIESLFFNTNAKTAILAAHARGVIVLAGVQAGLPVFDYTPLQVKQALLGYGRAEKKQVQTMVQFQLQLKEKVKQDDAADGLAIALTHAFTNQKLQ